MAHSLRVHSPSWQRRNGRQWEHGTAGPITSVVRKQSGMDDDAWLSFSFLFSSESQHAVMPHIQGSSSHLNEPNLETQVDGAQDSPLFPW